MHRTTVMLPEDLKRRAAERASRMGVSLGHVVREALERYLERATLQADPLFAFDNVFEGDTPPDLSARHDDHLYSE